MTCFKGKCESIACGSSFCRKGMYCINGTCEDLIAGGHKDSNCESADAVEFINKSDIYL
jgi:hypothetical protein